MVRRARKPREPRAPVTYAESDVVRDVALRLVRVYPAHFGWVNNFAIGYVMVHGSRRREGEIDVAAKFRKVPPVYHGITGFDAVVEVHAWAWTELAAEQQEALITHSLCHGEMTERGTLRVVKHDLTEFRWVVANYGAWYPEIRAFDEQLALFDSVGPGYRTPKVEREPLDLDGARKRRPKDSDQPPVLPA